MRSNTLEKHIRAHAPVLLGLLVLWTTDILNHRENSKTISDVVYMLKMDFSLLLGGCSTCIIQILWI